MGQVFHNLSATVLIDFIPKYGGINFDLLQWLCFLNSYAKFAPQFFFHISEDFEPASRYKFMLRDIGEFFYGECKPSYHLSAIYRN